MSDGVTNKDLEYLRDRINKATDSPTEGGTKDDAGKYRSNVGHYCLSGAYGGVKLERIVSDGGGVETVSKQGFGTKRQLYDWMNAITIASRTS